MQVRLGVLPGSYESGETFSDVMAYNHLGTETIPPRPVLRIAAEKMIPANSKRIKAFLHNLIVNPRESGRLETVLLTSLGQQSAAEAKRIINNNGGDLQHNAPATVEKKGMDHPLFVDGELSKHVSYEVVNE